LGALSAALGALASGVLTAAGGGLCFAGGGGLASAGLGEATGAGDFAADAGSDFWAGCCSGTAGRVGGLASTAFNGVDFEEGTELTGLAGAGAGTEGLGTVVFGGTDGAGPDGALFKVERKPVVWLAAGAAAGLLVAGRCPAEVEPTALIWLADTARALALLYICALKAANFFISVSSGMLEYRDVLPFLGDGELVASLALSAAPESNINWLPTTGACVATEP
jgi:hypothetical protein